MFHFWFNTFFVAVDHEEHTVTLKSGRRSQTPRLSATTSSSIKLHSAEPTVRPVQTSSRRQSGDDLSKRTETRTVDRVMKPVAVRTSSGTSSASSNTPNAVTLRRSSQPRDPTSIRPHSVHVSSPLMGTEAATNLSSSTRSLNINVAGKTLKDNWKSSSCSAGTTQRSRPLHRQEAACSPRVFTAQVNGHSEALSREERKNPGAESSASSARQGNPRSSKGVGPHRVVARSDSARLSRTDGVEARKTPEHNGILCPSTGSGGGRKLSKENVLTGQSVEQPVVEGGMKKASSTTALNKPAKKDSPPGHYAQHATSSSKAPSGVQRFIQSNSASRRVAMPNKSATPHHTTVSRRASDHPVLKGGATGGRLVSPAVQARSEALPSNPVSLTRFTPRSSRPNPSTMQPSRAVYDVSTALPQPTTFYTLTLPKSEIDKANKDVQQKVYSSDFKVVTHMLLVQITHMQFSSNQWQTLPSML